MSQEEVTILLARLEPQIRMIARMATIPNMDPDDIAQEFRIRVWEKAHLFSNGKSKPETFANTVFRNMLRNMYRDQSRYWRDHLALQHGELEDQWDHYQAELSQCFDHDTLHRIVTWELTLNVTGVVEEIS